MSLPDGYLLLNATRAANHHLPPEDDKHPAEVCDKFGPGWFWSTEDNESRLKSAEDIAAMVGLSCYSGLTPQKRL